MTDERVKRGDFARNREESERSGDKVGASRRRARSGLRCAHEIYDEQRTP